MSLIDRVDPFDHRGMVQWLVRWFANNSGIDIDPQTGEATHSVHPLDRAAELDVVIFDLDRLADDLLLELQCAISGAS
jgi:hypothetical protein